MCSTGYKWFESKDPAILLGRSGMLGVQSDPAECKKLKRSCKYGCDGLEQFIGSLGNITTPDMSVLSIEEFDSSVSKNFRVFSLCG